jgi:predicted RNase H-like HicB family nuclease
MARVERITWDYTGEYNVKRLTKRKYLVCVEDSVCFMVYNAKTIEEAIQAVEEHAKITVEEDVIESIEKIFT